MNLFKTFYLKINRISNRVVKTIKGSIFLSIMCEYLKVTYSEIGSYKPESQEYILSTYLGENILYQY